MKEKGFLEIFLGSMYSGKTTKLLELHRQYTFCKVPVLVINHPEDNRYGDSTILTTHDKHTIPCIVPSSFKLMDIFSQTLNVDVILINEGQFFEDLYDFVFQLLNLNKKVYVSGLDGDFERKKFGQILDLIPLCDKVSKLTSLCSLCKNGEPGIFSLRLTMETEQMMIGTDNYIPVCRNCYNSHNYHHSFAYSKNDNEIFLNSWC